MSDPMREIRLLNVSASRVKEIVKRSGVDGLEPNATKLEMVRALVGALRPEQIDALAGDYMFAGQTAVSWVRLGDGPLDDSALREAIIAVAEGDPFETSLRPNVTKRPKVVEARVRDDGTVVVTFVVAKPLRPIMLNFEIVSLAEDHFFAVIIRPELGVVEIRSSQERAVKATNTFVTDLAHQLGVEPELVGINPTELDNLRLTLRAILDRYRGKDQEGSPIDVRDLKKADDCPDLALEDEFKSETASSTPIRVTWVFNYDGDDITVQVSRKGSVWFRSSATEEIIDHVFSAIRRVKGF